MPGGLAGGFARGLLGAVLLAGVGAWVGPVGPRMSSSACMAVGWSASNLATVAAASVSNSAVASGGGLSRGLLGAVLLVGVGAWVGPVLPLGWSASILATVSAASLSSEAVASDCGSCSSLCAILPAALARSLNGKTLTCSW